MSLLDDGLTFLNAGQFAFESLGDQTLISIHGASEDAKTALKQISKQQLMLNDMHQTS